MKHHATLIALGAVAAVPARAAEPATRGVSGVVGIMYTTWAHRYGLLEAYGKALTAS